MLLSLTFWQVLAYCFYKQTANYTAMISALVCRSFWDTIDIWSYALDISYNLHIPLR